MKDLKNGVYKINSDLPVPDEGVIFLVQPKEIFDGVSLEDMHSKNDHFWRRIFRDLTEIQEGRVTHVGNIIYNRRNNQEMHLEFNPCGEDVLTIRPQRREIEIHCSKCVLMIDTPCSNEECLKESMFNLMLKQVFPLIRTCYFIEIHGYGVIAVAESGKESDSLQLGFLLSKGTKTWDFNGLDQWIRFLFYAYRRKILVYLNGGREKLLGPRNK